VIVGKASELHEDVARAVRLTATRGSGDLSQLKAEIDRGLRTGRYLGYRESGGWAMQARPVVEAISEAVDSSPTAELVALMWNGMSTPRADLVRSGFWSRRTRGSTPERS